jgi:predicted DNA-binding protein with PD1-like motif
MTLVELAATAAFAEENGAAAAVVNKSTCAKLANTTQPFILVLNSGDELISTISQCAKDAKLMGASVSGLGQLHNPILAYFSSNAKDKPALTTMTGYYELASVNGNVSANGGNYYTHVHGVLADKQFHALAGHINSAKVGLTVEITVIPFAGPVQRSVDAETGFGPLIQG